MLAARQRSRYNPCQKLRAVRQPHLYDLNDESSRAPKPTKRRPPERLTEMDDEKFERQMEFILNQQAQFAAKIGQLEENLARLTGVVERVVDTVDRLVQVTAERFEAVDRRADEFDTKLAALVDAQIRTEEEARKREESMRSLEETMRSLAATVERHIADGHGRKQQPES